jgi:hypothetical protein
MAHGRKFGDEEIVLSMVGGRVLLNPGESNEQISGQFFHLRIIRFKQPLDHEQITFDKLV